MNFKQYINENDKLNAFKSFANTDYPLDLQIWDYFETWFPELYRTKTLVKGSHAWGQIRTFIMHLIHDPENENFGVHYYAEWEKSKQILEDFIKRNNLFDGI